MSHFTTLSTQITDRDALIRALADLGFSEQKLKVTDRPVPLEGFLGDRREQLAEVIIPKKHVGRLSNDIGFERIEDGTYRAWISEFDRPRYGDAWLDRLYSRYAYHATVATMTRQGFTVAQEETSSAGEIRLVLRRYR